MTAIVSRLHKSARTRDRAIRRLVGTAICATILLALAPAGANAAVASVAVETQPDGSGTFTVVTYTAFGGETNDVTVTQGGSAIFIRDPGAVIEAGFGCSNIDERQVTCAAEEAKVFVGDMADRVFVQGPVGRDVGVHGGVGNDTLTDRDGSHFLAGDDGSDTLDGGGGQDSLEGGGGRDQLFGGAGEDLMADGDGLGAAPVDSDVFDGGPGRDAIDYSKRVAPIVVNLADPAGPLGEVGENDVGREVENAYGGAGDDTLGGDDGRNFFIGNGGDDSLAGLSGKDRLYGSEGDDLLLGQDDRDIMAGGSGEDVLDGADGHDALYGGGSRDFLSGGDGKDLLAGDTGNDRMEGDSGRDRYFGGDGNDLLDAVDGRREAVDCGRGSDRAEVDPQDDRRRCERQRVTATGRPR
jgi:Ca2+-binding RTX toxin-like protein